MAKNIVLAILVGVGDMLWRPAKNTGRHQALADDEKKRCAHAFMMTDGWDVNQPIECSEFDEEGLKDAAAIITAGMEALENIREDSVYPTTPNTKLTIAQRREAYRAVWFPDGKLRLPKYDATFGFQRGLSLTDAIALKSAITGEKVKDVANGYKLPARIVKYESEADRILACNLENTRKDTGRTSVVKHWPTLFQMAYDYYVARAGNVTMAEINEMLAGGKVQNNNDGIKVHSLLVLDHRFPEAGIKDKLLSAGVDKDGKDLGQEFGESMDRTRVWKMVQYLDAKKVQSDIANPKIDSTYSKDTTLEVVSEYLADPHADDEVKVKPATAKLIATNVLQSPSLIVKYVLKAVALNRMDLLSAFYMPSITAETKQSLDSMAEHLGIAKNGKIGTTDKAGNFTELV